MPNFLGNLLNDAAIAVVKTGVSVFGDSGGDDETDDSKQEFLHGRLRVTVHEAEGLPDTDTVFFNIDAKDVTDPYVTAELGPARLFKTKYILNELNPVWNESFDVYVCHNANTLAINVKDKEHVGSEFIATCQVRVNELLHGDPIDGWFDLINGDKNHGRIRLSMQYVPKESLAEDSFNVDDAYFPVRENCRLTLYQDADTAQLPQFEGLTHAADGSPYQATTAWKDLYAAIEAAQKFIYITGWSVFTGICLVRGDDDPDGASNVGELLKRKAEEGVKVLLLVWNEKLSTEGSPGLMGTHDEETRVYFQGTGVECLLANRSKNEGVLASEFVGTCYTHHQKTVIVDAPVDGDDSVRRLVAFIGGLDITDGRYDSPEFPLWATVPTLHAEDFYNNCVPGVTKETGPREPWHDCHARVEGRAVLDIMKNFEERWRRQGENQVQSLVHLDESEILIDAEPPVPENEGGLWNAQLFRSITSDSCLFDFDRHEILFSKDGKLVEDTIMRCLVHQIRNAQNFIYLENQYFLGSAYSWYSDQKTLTMHIVPREITQKIVEKIAAGEMFKVYALIPMFPEGDPSSAAIQEILYWQHLTMICMYRRIARAIEQFDAGTHPTDYLNFYCLGKRESPDEMPEETFADPEPDSLAEKVRQSRRHPIYVHSKMTLFDDAYVLVGSANINQRSMGGNRDTEIAIGAFQPGHTVEEEGDPRGDVHMYRMALWSAHLGGYDETYLNPASEECLAKVREVTSAYWELYTADEPEHSDVHLLPYPVKVEEDGSVVALDEPWDCFPDTSAKVVGEKSGYLPVKLTT